MAGSDKTDAHSYVTYVPYKSLDHWLDTMLAAPDMMMVYTEPFYGLAADGQPACGTLRCLVTARDAINYQRSKPGYEGADDRQLLTDFVMVNWAIPSNAMTRKHTRGAQA